MERRTARTVRIVVDVCVTILVATPTIALYIGNVAPVRRGFFCNDENIMYPYKEKDTVGIAMVAGICFGSTLLLLLPTEIVQYRSAMKDGRAMGGKAICCCTQFNPCIYTICSYFWLMQFGAMATQALTDIGKYSVGRLRPNFFAGCRPDINLTDCTMEYITDYNCLQPHADILHFIRTSFPSGHASQSAYVATFLCYYIQTRIPRFDLSYLYKHFLQFLLMTAAYFTGLSRILDYKHHMSDVLAGFLLGATVALLTVKYVAKSFRDPYRTAGRVSRRDANV
ncbi:phospholipid phosphatase 1-like [Watersipora subatra]|uniref:phospholipid phosphatase 1-like n=1 Tax=Watersipora subatra TaxID=2589382 RepID=UPI00355BCD62